jgi:hypothetical protein
MTTLKYFPLLRYLPPSDLRPSPTKDGLVRGFIHRFCAFELEDQSTLTSRLAESLRCLLPT